MSLKTLNRKAFSLIELLVVLAIVALLFALLILGLGRFKDYGYSIQCVSNLREVVLAGRAFAMDNNGVMHSRNLEYPSTHASAPGIADYLGFVGYNYEYRDTVFSCPAEQNGDKPSAYIYHRTYAVNGHTIYYPSRKETETQKSYSPRIDDFIHPGETAYMMDGGINTDHIGPGYRYFNHLTETSIARTMRFPHDNKVNVAFFDASVKSFTKDSVPKQRLTYFWWGDVNEANRYRR